MQLTGQSTSPMSQEPSLENTLKAFIQSNNQGIQELKDATKVNSQSMYEINDAAMANTEAIARLEGQLGHVVGEFNRIKEVVKEIVKEGGNHWYIIPQLIFIISWAFHFG